MRHNAHSTVYIPAVPAEPISNSGRNLMSAREIDMLHGTLWNKIIVFAIPLVLTGIFEQLFNAADTLILGR